MILFALRKCAFRVQMCQLVTYNMCNENLMKMKGLHYSKEVKYMNFKNPNFIVYKYISTNPATKEVTIPRLMQCTSVEFSPFLIFLWYLPLRLHIDPSFKIFEFLKGAGQAITVISNALAVQNYEILHNMVQERTLKLLKRRVDLLSEQQRKLLPINIDNNYLFPFFFIYDVNMRHNEDGTEITLDIAVAGCQKRSDCTDELTVFEDGFIKQFGRQSLCYTYIFRRKYINGDGGPWMVKLVSYGNINTYLDCKYRIH